MISKVFNAARWRVKALLERGLRPRQAAILMYHRIARPGDDDVWDLCVTPEHFQAQLEVMKRRGPILPLGELLRKLDDGTLPRGASAITFDDGYLDNATAALPILEAMDAPATIFVASADVGRGTAFWWDRLISWQGDRASLPGPIRLSSPSAARDWTDEEERARSREGLNQSLWEWLAPLPNEERDARITDLEQQAGRSDRNRPPPPLLAPDDVARLAAHELIEIGGHTATHPHLSWLSAKEQRAEIQGGREALETWTNRPVTGFSYPFGNHNQDSQRILRDLGFRYATANVFDTLTARSDRFALPRLYARNLDADGFAKEVFWRAG
mgnify:FL=1